MISNGRQIAPLLQDLLKQEQVEASKIARILAQLQVKEGKRRCVNDALPNATRPGRYCSQTQTNRDSGGVAIRFGARARPHRHRPITHMPQALVWQCHQSQSWTHTASNQLRYHKATCTTATHSQDARILNRCFWSR